MHGWHKIDLKRGQKSLTEKEKVQKLQEKYTVKKCTKNKDHTVTNIPE